MNKRQDDEIPVFMNRENWPEMLKKKEKAGDDANVICIRYANEMTRSSDTWSL